jgi:hypothetical protein
VNRFLLLAVVLVACRADRSASMRKLAIEGLTVQVPAGFVPLEEDRIRQLRDSYVRQEPDSEVSMSGVRGATLVDGTVYLAHAVSQRDLTGTVGDTLASAAHEMTSVLVKGGAQLKDQRTSIRNGGLEACVVAVLPAPTLPPTRLCSLFYVGADQRVRALSTTCMARDAAVCERVLASRTYAVTGAIDLTRELQRARPPSQE